MPFDARDQQKCHMNGDHEPDDLAIAPLSAAQREEAGEDPAIALGPEVYDKKHYYPNDWAHRAPEGPRRKRAYVAIREEPAAMDGDPHMYEGRQIGNQRLGRGPEHHADMTGGCCSLSPQWRRKPHFIVYGPAGQAAMLTTSRQSSEEDASKWKRAFFADSRMNYIRSHYHSCGPTCYKYNSRIAGPGLEKICRFQFYHDFKVEVFSRFKPNSRCTRPDTGPNKCPCVGSTLPCGKSYHPHLCPQRPLLRTSKERNHEIQRERRFWRKGKRLVVPQLKVSVPYAVDPDTAVDPCVQGVSIPVEIKCAQLNWPTETESWQEDVLDSSPQICTHESAIQIGRAHKRDVGRGHEVRVGQVHVMRSHPCTSSSNPVLQVCGRCNWDLQPTDVLPVLVEQHPMRVPRVPLPRGGGSGLDDEDDFFEDINFGAEDSDGPGRS